MTIFQSHSLKFKGYHPPFRQNYWELALVTFGDAKNVAAILTEALDPFSVITFGSVARDEMGTDLDLLVVVNDESKVSGDVNLYAPKCL